MNQTVAQALQSARKQLVTIDAQSEARLMLEHVLSCDAAHMLLQNERTLSDDEQTKLHRMLCERLHGRPLQYIFGEWEFMGLPFSVREGVLIPRSDTETLCEKALELAKKQRYYTALDLCTGSGCIAVALASIGKLTVTAVDLSDDALVLAAQNANKNGVQKIITFIKSDMFQAVDGEYDLIVSNPPYIRSQSIKTLMREVRDYEPLMALDGGADGLDFYRIIANQAPKVMKRGGALLVECGCSQAQAVAALFLDAGLQAIEVYRDLCGIERVVKAERLH